MIVSADNPAIELLIESTEVESMSNFALISGEIPSISEAKELTLDSASVVSAPTFCLISRSFVAVWNCCKSEIALLISPSTCEVSTRITSG